jgi:hypothetical protein
MIIKKVFYDGYERLLMLDVNGQKVVASTLDTSSFKTQPKELYISEYTITSGFFLKYASICSEKVDDFLQPINMSPSTLLTGVIERIDGDVVTLSTRALGSVIVELEDDYVDGEIFRGELFVECELTH